MKTTRELYCQYLVSSQINYTCTNLADHVEELDHNSVYRYLKFDKLTPRLVWEKVRPLLVYSPRGCLIFDDVVLEKEHSFAIEGVRKQYSGNRHQVIKGIGVVNCVYYNPDTEQFWVIDFRLFDPGRDGKSKHDHVADMLKSVEHRGIVYQTALMDAWYATAQLMVYFIRQGKLFYCPLKSNRKVDESGEKQPYQPVSSLQWSPAEEQAGKTVKIHKFPMNMKVKLFRVPFSTERTDFIVTNDMTQPTLEGVQQANGRRWKVEQLHREEKQITGIARCQCRLNRSQRNHICCSVLVWVYFKNQAYQLARTVYQLKHQLLKDYLKTQLVKPSLKFS
jgi:hypothetical protein